MGYAITCLSRAHPYPFPSPRRITSQYDNPSQRRLVSTNYLPGVNVCALINSIFHSGPHSSAKQISPFSFRNSSFFFFTYYQAVKEGSHHQSPPSPQQARRPANHRARARWRTRESWAGALRWGRWPSMGSISTVVLPPRWLLR